MPALIPSIVGLFLIQVVFVARKNQLVGCQAAAGLGLLVASWFVSSDLVLRFVGGALFSSMIADRLRDPTHVKNRKGNLLLLATFGPMFVLLGYLNRPPPPEVVRITESALTVTNGAYQQVLPRSALRIVEFAQVPHRRWHVKDGTHVVNLSEGGLYTASNGEVWTARELIIDLENWAGVRREHTNRDP